MNQTVLAFDTCGPYCTAALLSQGQIVGQHHQDMGKGQGERLMPILQELLQAQGYDWADLSGIGVGTGPGNFTGTRIGVAAARGLALGLGVPALGVSSFEALCQAHGRADETDHLIVLPQRGGHVLHAVTRGRLSGAPISQPSLDPSFAAPPQGTVILGEAASDVAQMLEHAHNRVFTHRNCALPPRQIARQIATIAAARLGEGGPRPAPLYPRPADAAPPRDPAPVILP